MVEYVKTVLCYLVFFFLMFLWMRLYINGMVGHFDDVYRKKKLKVNARNGLPHFKVSLNGEELVVLYWKRQHLK